MIADAEQNNSESWITDDVKENENDEVITNFVSASQLQICSACYFIIDYRIGMLFFVFKCLNSFFCCNRSITKLQSMW